MMIGTVAAAICFLAGVVYLAVPKQVHVPLGSNAPTAVAPGEPVPTDLARARPAQIVRTLYPTTTSLSCRQTPPPKIGRLARVGPITRCVGRQPGLGDCLTLITGVDEHAPRILRHECTT